VFSDYLCAACVDGRQRPRPDGRAAVPGRVGKLDKALDEGLAKGWTIVDMKRDWRTIFPNR
jgi:hypothetical protein